MAVTETKLKKLIQTDCGPFPTVCKLFQPTNVERRLPRSNSKINDASTCDQDEVSWTRTSFPVVGNTVQVGRVSLLLHVFDTSQRASYEI